MQRQQWTRNGKSLRPSQHGMWEKSRAKRRSQRGTENNNKVHFASLMDLRHLKTSEIRHLKNAELETKHKGRVVFRGDIVKDDSGAYAVFTEHGSSASQMTASKVMDVTARQAADAIGVHPGKNRGCSTRMRRTSSGCSICLHQVKMKDTPSLWMFPKSECPDIWIRLPRHTLRKSWSMKEDSVVPLERNLCGHLLAGWERQFEKVLLENGGKSSKLGMLIRQQRVRTILVCVMWAISKWQERNKIWTHCGRYLWKTLIWENQHHSLTMIIWAALNEKAKQAKILLTTTGMCCESRMSAGGIEKYLIQRNMKRSFPHGPMTWKVMQRNAWKDTANLRTKEFNSYTKSQLHVFTTTNSKKK